MLVNLMTHPNKTRPYNSLRRREQAEATRQKIIDAAHRLFVAHGYTATTLPVIAREAGVSMPTVTAIFGTKYALLNALIKTTVRGDDASAPLVDSSWWQAMVQEPDPLQQLTLYGANVRNIHERTTDIFEIVRGAATADAELAALQRNLTEARLGDVRMVAQSLSEKGALKQSITLEQATDILWALGSADLYRMLVVDRGWSSSQYQHWLVGTLMDSLLSFKRGQKLSHGQP